MSFSLAVPPLACAFPQTAVLAFMLRAAQAWTKLLAKERAADWSYIALSNSLVGECSEPSNHAAPRPPHHQRSHQALTGNSQPLALAAAPYFSRFLPARQYCTTPPSPNRPSSSDAAAAWPPAPVHWIEAAAPKALLPYIHLARLHKPIGSWLLLWPCLWSTALATQLGHPPDLRLIGLFGAGAVVRSPIARPRRNTRPSLFTHFIEF